MSEETDKFVADMLKRSKEKQQSKPQSGLEGVNPNDIERITTNIRDALQKKKK